MKIENERIIDVSEDPVADSRPTEVPLISIERDAEGASGAKAGVGRSGRWQRLRKWVVAAIAVLVLASTVIFLFKSREVSGESDSDSMRDAENIAVLSEPYVASAVGTAVLTDSLLGVGMDIYPLAGLRASLEWEFPDTADHTLVMFMRTADYHPDGRPLGPVVVDGIGSACKPVDSRDGYVAVSPNGRAVAGISPTDDVEEWTRKNKGGFFRQMVLLDDGELPRDFILRGKVERGAIVTSVEGTLYYVVTHGRESMYDFADALREYGFVDAVYMTGGNSYSFHRDSTGNSHVNSATLEKIGKYESRPLPQPLLVFRSASADRPRP